MGAMIRGHDWASTPLGPIDAWPAALKIAAGLALDCRFPMIVLWGPELIQIYNDGFRDLIGEKHPAALGRTTRECCPELREITDPIFDRVWRGETVTLTDQLLPIARHSYNEQAYFTMCYSPLRDEPGVIAGVLGTVFETTGRLRAETALRESEERLRFVLEGSKLGTWESDTSTGELTWSDRTLALFGLPPGTRMNAERFMASIHPDDRAKVAAAIRRSIDLNEEYETEYRCIWPDGSIHWVHSRGRRYGDPYGRHVRLAGIAFDITDRKRAEEALRENEERLRVVVDAARLGTWDLNTITGELVWSDRCLALFGFPAGTKMTFERFLAAVHPEDRHKVTDVVRFPPEGEMGFSIEIRSVWPDGSIHWVDSTGRRYADESGRVVRISGVAIDIDDRKRAEQALRESEERLRFIMEAAELGPWEWKIASDELAWSDRCLAIFGLAPGTKITHEQFWASVHPEDRGVVDAAMRRALEEGVEYEAEYRAIWPDGSIHWIHSRGRRYDDQFGRPARVIGVALDMTGRKRAEQAVRESEEWLRLLIDNVREYALIQTDIEGRITGWNKGAERLFGYSTAEVLGWSAARLLTPEDQDAHVLEREISQASRGERTQEERWMVRKDGARFWVSWVIEPVRGGAGRLLGFAAIFRDETERRRASEVALQRQKLQSVGVLAGGIAHDFNNLLTGITGNASLIVDEVPPRVAGRVRQILNSAEHAAQLIRQLLAYSGKGQFQVQEVDVSETVNAIRGLVQFSIPKSVQLVITVQTRLPCIVIDPNQLQQILMNLAINAGEAVGEGNAGKITIATGWSDVESPFVDAVGQEVAPGRYVWIEVRDTGGGIAEENKSRIFDPFFTTKFTGRGLGLAAVAGIVRAKKGAITVESEPGRGSTFRVYLPAAGRYAASEQPAAAGRATVLVVDDEETVRDVANAVLGRRGYRVITAADGYEALAVFEREGAKVDAVVLDVVMPIMSAHDLIPALKSRRPNIRILLTSGYSEAEARRLSEAAPDCAFLAKPFTADQIGAAVDELIGAAR